MFNKRGNNIYISPTEHMLKRDAYINNAKPFAVSLPTTYGKTADPQKNELIWPNKKVVNEGHS